jgi:hypothetical protein
MAGTKGDDLTAYCGLDCGGCFTYTKIVSEAAKQLRRTMRAEKIKQVWPTIPFLGDYNAFKKHLDALAGLMCRGCLEGVITPFVIYVSVASGMATIAVPSAMS